MDLDVRKMVMGMISVIIALVLVVGCAVPIIQESVDDQKTVFNNDYNRYSQLLDSDIDNFTMTVTWDITTTTASVSINGADPYNYSMSSTRAPLIVTEGGTLEANKTNSRGILKYSGSATATNITAGPITIAVANGVVTLTDGATTPNEYTWDVGSWLFYPDNNGNYTAMNTTTDKDTEIYLNSINDLYFATVIGTNSLGFVSGHGDSCKFFSQTNTPTYSMSLLNSSKVNGFTDVIATTIGNYAISTDAGTNQNETPFVPFITMVPRAVDGHTSMDNSLISMLSIIPVLMILAIVIGAVGMFIKTRRN